jgi:hypothetical protein
MESRKQYKDVRNLDHNNPSPRYAVTAHSNAKGGRHFDLGEDDMARRLLTFTAATAFTLASGLALAQSPLQINALDRRFAGWCGKDCVR